MSEDVPNVRLRRVDDVTGPTQDRTKVFVWAVVILCTLGVTSIMAIIVVSPKEEQLVQIGTVTGFLVPIVSTLLALAMRDVKDTVNGRMSEVMMLTARTSAAEARMEEKAEIINIVKELALQVPPPPPQEK